MEVAENILCFQICFQQLVSGPLIQENLSAKSDLDTAGSFDVVFSSDRSAYQFSTDLGDPDVTGSDTVVYSWSDRFTGKPVSQTKGLYCHHYRRV